MKNFTLECCVDSVESALAAEAGGATRLELCSGLVIGGLSPSVALFDEIRAHCRLGIRVLIRPRFGDFLYTSHELAVMEREVALFRERGAAGVVFGVLTAAGDLDCAAMARLIRAAGPMAVTLHRAFDMCRNPLAALREAENLGVATLLTSGQQDTAIAGLTLLVRLRQAATAVDIMPGAGVDAAAIRLLRPATGCLSYHMSGKVTLESAMAFRNADVNMGLPAFSEYDIWRTGEENVRAARQALEELP